MARELKPTAAIPPQNLEAEESVLGAMMMSPGAIISALDQLHRTDFYRDSHREIYGSIVDLFNQGEPVDQITVTEHLAHRGVLERVGGKAYIHTLVSTVPVTANAAHYARIVRENAILRSLIDVGNRITALGYDRPGEVRELLDRCESMVFEISQEQIKGEFRHMKELLSDQFERIEKLHEAGKAITGVPTGFHDLDKKTSGFQQSNLIILAARPSMGKTALALNLAQNIAVKQGIPVALFSLEMSEMELAQRMMCTQGRIDSERLRNGAVSADDWTKLTEACTLLQKAPIYVDDTPNMNMLEIRAKTRRLKSKHPDLGLVIVDYLQLMMSDERVESRQQEISKISRSMKILARELELPLLAISQLSRAVESRTPPRPVLSDLRESGAIEQDADVVMFIYRPRDESGKLENTAELIIAKHRNGPTGTVDLVFTEKYTSFASAARRA
ncbi:MAG: replicative DNA helicase [Thermoleophilia bacterium]|jgi:replicative DNA helicase|nr:replicative DNA helicase [Actinomycetota bacterium]MCL6093988.1 replicative DNA helicase [Actinomycetota bacterium]MDA8167055.1 replicative DNA helicase [Actinomycetota bacterium]